jgi:ribonuclease HI
MPSTTADDPLPSVEKDDSLPVVIKSEYHNGRFHIGGARKDSYCLFPRQEWLEGDHTNEERGFEVMGESGFLHVRCPSNPLPNSLCVENGRHIDSMVIEIAGYCPNSGSESADRSSCGIYFGNPGFNAGFNAIGAAGHQLNHHFRIIEPAGVAYCTQRAELCAAIVALIAARYYTVYGGQWPCVDDECNPRCPIRHVVIKTRSQYLVHAVVNATKDNRWKLNKWLASSGTQVTNRVLWMMIARCLDVLEYLDTTVDFYLVPLSATMESYNLAKAGINSQKWLSPNALMAIWPFPG